MIPALIACFYAGIAAGWLLRGAFTPAAPASAPASASAPESTSGPAGTELLQARASVDRDRGDPISELRAHGLQLPIDGADVNLMKNQFAETRDGGGRGHEAVDILAPRNTPIRAVENGTIAKLFESKAGGTTVYQFDPTGRFCYYYAHLERYAAGLHDGQRVSKGDVIGYVGTSGNAPANTPHLHFAIFELTAQRRWWDGKPLDPYLAFRP
jgi:murein DD-endopeptidase MepM/ murein hydrolase activator NlpD